MEDEAKAVTPELATSFETKSRIFRLYRSEKIDAHGSGLIGEGVVFDDGSVTVQWMNVGLSATVYSGLPTVMDFYVNKNSVTRLVFADGGEVPS